MIGRLFQQVPFMPRDAQCGRVYQLGGEGCIDFVIWYGRDSTVMGSATRGVKLSDEALRTPNRRAYRMGMPALQGHRWTREEVLALPDDGNKYELIDGELLVSPSPRGLHQRGVFELTRLVDPYVRVNRLGYLMCLPADLDFRADHLLQPDIFVGAMIDGREPIEWSDYGIPILIVEVLSPSTARYDRITKRRFYQRSGVPVYWIVDLDARLVEVWRPESQQPDIVDGELTWAPLNDISPLVIDLSAYFRAVWGEGR